MKPLAQAFCTGQCVQRPACRPLLALAIAALVAVSVAGCTAYREEPLQPSRSADAFAARRLDDPALRRQLERLLPHPSPSWPPAAWNRAQLLAVAIAQNPQLQLARSEALAVEAREIGASTLPNPDLTLQSEYARNDAHPWLYGLSAAWLMPNRGRRRLDQRIARLETGNARLRLMDRVWAVRQELVAALSDLESARRRSQVLERLIAAQDRLISVQRRRIEAGEDPPGELIAGQRAQLEDQQERERLRAAADTASVAVAKALGLPPRALDDTKFAWPDWGDPPPVDDDRIDAMRERALLSRADLAAAIGGYAIAEARLQRAVLRQYPEFTLGPGYYWDHGIAKFPFDVGFTLPLNRNRGEIAAARADRDAAAERMLALQADIYGQIAGAQRAEHIARAGALTAARSLAAAHSEQRQADLALQVGEEGVQQQVGAEIRVARAELDLLQARAQLQDARNALEGVLRMPLSGPELSMTMPGPSPEPADGAGT